MEPLSEAPASCRLFAFLFSSVENHLVKHQSVDSFRPFEDKSFNEALLGYFENKKCLSDQKAMKRDEEENE